MRPRPDAAENQNKLFHKIFAAWASMRPRPDAAENRMTIFQSAWIADLLQ